MYGGSLGQISNKATWENGFEIIDAATDDFMDLTGADITMKVARLPCLTTVLTASTDDGKITIPALGSFDFRFETSETANLCAATYVASITLLRDGTTEHVFLGTVAVLEAP